MFPPIPDPAHPTQLLIKWSVQDKNLIDAPVNLEYAETPKGPWLPIELNLRNTGRHVNPQVTDEYLKNPDHPSNPLVTGDYSWKVPSGTPIQVYLRVRRGPCRQRRNRQHDHAAIRRPRRAGRRPHRHSDEVIQANLGIRTAANRGTARDAAYCQSNKFMFRRTPRKFSEKISEKYLQCVVLARYPQLLSYVILSEVTWELPYAALSPPPPPQRLSTIWISRILGLVLLTAAGLKAYGFGGVDPVARTGSFSSPGFQFFVILFEIGLGVWLLSGQQPLASWLAVLVTFSVFAGISCYQGWIGQANCGCLGKKVTVNPWIMFGVDLTAVAAPLLIGRPNLKWIWDDRVQIARSLGSIVGGYLLLLGLATATAYLGYGSIDAAIASLRRERLSVHPSIVDMGEGAPGETRNANVELTNRTDQSIQVFGGTADCSCTVLANLPVTIPPGETRSVKVAVRLPNAAGTFNRKAALQIEDVGFKRSAFV